MKSITKIKDYFTSSLNMTFDHPLRTMNENDMLEFLRGVLQIYLEYWNSNISNVLRIIRCTQSLEAF